ncbi:MAG TPA: hypothetical protein DEQ38_14240 [Elusimicrobia bacterium]|nr:MAG: hypothetical protein A2089_07050 [Elusimicrobia bacterium GWD2_63_28]HCC49257.1 hypothetical protein [Elusimicrobiota bacterium]
MRLKDNKKYYRKFSVGYNGDKDFFRAVVLPFKKYISSVYSTPGLSLGVSSARFVPGMPPGRLRALRAALKAENIGFNLVYNFDGISGSAALPGLVKIANALKPDAVTVNGTCVMDEFLRLGRYELSISIINDINSLNQLHQLLERDPAGLITSYNIGRRKTYDLKYIAAVRKAFPGLKLRLMANEGCIFECPDQGFHSCSMTMGLGAKPDQGLFYCGKLAPDQRWRFLTGQYVPPKFLPRYAGLVDEFKVASRGVHGWPVSNDFIAGLLADYINEADVTLARGMQSAFGGTLFLSGNDARGEGGGKAAGAYLRPYPDDFFDVRTACAHDCWQCSYCRRLLAAPAGKRARK